MLEHPLAKQADFAEAHAAVQVRETTPLRFITCGSVDDGKSTLIGRLLWDTKAVPEDQAESIRVTGPDSDTELALPEFANLLDGLQAEREQGITIDVAYRYFSTPRRSFIVADTPGHAQYTRNMATGASTADLAVLLVDARAGILEQTRRHATIVSLMGIRQLILVVNKFDLVNYKKSRFDELVDQFSTLIQPLGFDAITAIPTSAVKGENVVSPAKATMSWYDGPTLVQALELAAKRPEQSIGFRFPVQRVSRPDESFRGYQGTIAGGSIKPGDPVTVLPSGEVANISKIVTFDLVRNAGVAGDAVTLVLDRPVDIARGDMIVSTGSKPYVGRSFDAKMIVLSDAGLQNKKRYWLKSSSRRQWVSVSLKSSLDLASAEWVQTSEMELNQIVEVQLDFDELAIFDPYEANRETGSFILIDPDTNQTVAGGMIWGTSNNVVRVDRGEETGVTAILVSNALAEEFAQLELLKESDGYLGSARLSLKDANALLGK